jgi:hypothetical protein
MENKMTVPALPAHLQQVPGQSLTDRLVQNLGVGSPPFVSILGGRFSLVDSTGEVEPVDTFDKQLGNYLDCCVVDMGDKISKIFYDKPFDPNAGQYEPPACPQSPTCASCPNSLWGSATSKVSGKGVKACQDYQKIALFPLGDDILFLMRVPPNSLKNLRDYAGAAKKAGIDLRNVVTRIWFEQGVLGTLKFKPVGYIDAEMAAQRNQVLVEKTSDGMVGRLDVPRTAALPSPSGAASTAGQQRETRSTARQEQPSGTHTQQDTHTQPAGASAATASPSEPAPRTRRKRNTQQAPAGGVAAGAQQEAPFMPAGQQGGAFGMAPGAEPNKEIAAAVDALFPMK